MPTTIQEKTGPIGTASETFTLTLDKVLREGSCPTVAKGAQCVFSYIWDFPNNVGIATLKSIDDTPVNITLHPIGISGVLAFMSDMPPTPYKIRGEDVVIFRVGLDLYAGSDRRAFVMWNEDGACITTTKNWVGAGMQ